MKHISNFTIFEKKSLKDKDIHKDIKFVRGISKELKDVALSHLKEYSNASKGKITGLTLHKDLRSKINSGNLPSGFDMGIDKGGYFIHTHRARSKSYESPEGIPQKDIKFVDSTG